MSPADLEFLAQVIREHVTLARETGGNDCEGAIALSMFGRDLAERIEDGLVRRGSRFRAGRFIDACTIERLE